MRYSFALARCIPSGTAGSCAPPADGGLIQTKTRTSQKNLSITKSSCSFPLHLLPIRVLLPQTAAIFPPDAPPEGNPVVRSSRGSLAFAISASATSSLQNHKMFLRQWVVLWSSPSRISLHLLPRPYVVSCCSSLLLAFVTSSSTSFSITSSEAVSKR